MAKANAVVDERDQQDLDPVSSFEFTHPTRYRTFSRKLPIGFTGLGGALAILGGLGNWVRVASAARVGEPLREIGAVMGYRSSLGWTIAALGIMATAASVMWVMRSFVYKLVPLVSSVAIALITATHLPRLTSQARDFVEEAEVQLDFTLYHAGLGWGSWLLLTGTVLLLVGSFAGILREMDLRRGGAE